VEVLTDSLEIKAPQIADELRQYDDIKLIFETVNRFGIFLIVEPEVQNLEMVQDEVKFRQIAGNLIKNALHFRKKRLELLLYKAGENLILDVTDDGPGIPQEQWKSVFERYTQVEECALSMRNGHGLGLAGARIMARCLGGNIEIVINKDTGTTFQLILPIHFRSQDKL
jgi:signal transduction histidine kinase